MSVAVVTDTTPYLPSALAQEAGLHMVSLYVRFGDDVERESGMADFDAFYERLRRGGDLPTTSQPSIGDFLAVYEPLLEAGHDICSVHLSSGISGTYDSALQARAHLEERGLRGRIEVVDSRTTCAGQGFVALAAAAAARGGSDVQAVARRATEARDDVKIWFVLDTLEYLRRGGRVGAAQAWVGGALKIKPVLSIESTVLPVERVRTAAKAFDRMVDYLKSRKEDGADAWAVQHIQADDQAARLVDRGREIFDREPSFVSEVGPVIGVYAGPGMLGVSALPSAHLR